MSDHITPDRVEAAARAWIAAEDEYDPDDWKTEWSPGELRLLTAALTAALAVAPTVDVDEILRAVCSDASLDPDWTTPEEAGRQSMERHMREMGAPVRRSMSDHLTDETVDEAISEYQAYLVEGERTAMRAAIAAVLAVAPTVGGWVWCEQMKAVTGAIGGPHDSRWCPAFGGEGCPGPHWKMAKVVRVEEANDE